jgi:DNA (cytosine-5)-methyltransferase 1
MSKRVLSLFSGCGGMDLGLEGDFWIHKTCINEIINPDWIVDKNENQVKLKKTSLETVFANDINLGAKNAYLNYFLSRKKATIFHCGSIIDLVKFAQKGGFKFPENIDIVTGGFPCQDFSVSGKRNGFNSHKSHTGDYLVESEDTVENRGMLYYWMKKVIELTHPKLFIAENVKGLISLGNAKEIIQKDFANTGKDGYIIMAKLLFSPDYGIPQTRERIFFIGLNKTYLKPSVIKAFQNGNIPEEYNPFPSPTHKKVSQQMELSNLFYQLKPYPKLGDILEHLKEPKNEDFDLAQKSYSKAKYLPKGQGQIEVDLQGLSPTIRAEHHGNIEYRRLSRELGGKHIFELEKGLKMRRLTVRECARIQTFPDDYEFVINKPHNYPVSASQAYKIIGNAVPPLLAYHLAMRIETIWDYLFEKDLITLT